MNIKDCPHCGGTIYSTQEEPAAADWNNAACNDALRAWNMRTNEQEATQ